MSTSTDCPVTYLQPALRAIDRTLLATKGVHQAVALAPSEEGARRRARLALGEPWHDVSGHDAEQVADALRMWLVLHTSREQVAS